MAKNKKVKENKPVEENVVFIVTTDTVCECDTQCNCATYDIDDVFSSEEVANEYAAKRYRGRVRKFVVRKDFYRG